MSTKLTKKEKGFALDYIDTGNGTQSALNHYDTTDENVAASISSQNLRKLKIQNYLEESADGASSRVVELSKEAKNETVKLNANKDILDRAGFKPVERSESKSVRVNIEAKIENKELEKLRKKYENELKIKLLK